MSSMCEGLGLINLIWDCFAVGIASLLRLSGFGEGNMQIYFNELLPSIQSLGLWGYWLIGLLAFGEALVLTSVFAPGTVVVVLGGALVAQGLYDFGDMIWFVAIGTILGAEISFRIGAKGASLFQEGRRVFSQAHLERGKRFFEKYGAPSIILGHFFGPLRPVIPVVAGLSEMSRRRFFFWNVIGGFTYAVALLSVGYFFGTATSLFSATMTRAGLFAIAVLLAIALMWFAVVKLRKALPVFISVFRSVGVAVRDNPDVSALVERHPILFRFLSERMSRDSFVGLPVTILATAFVYFLFLYAGSTLDFVRQSQIVAADVRVANLLSAFRDPDLVQFFTLFTALGSWKVIAILAITVSAVLLLQRRQHYLPGLWLSLIGNQLTVTLLKIVFSRPRPEMAVYAESSYSFPSGHSAASVVFFGFLIFVLIRERVGPIVVSFLVGMTLIFLIGLSRIYLVEHYLSDVLNGYLVGTLWALIGIWLAEWLHTKRDLNTRIAISAWQKITSVAAVLGAIIAVVIIVEDYQQTRNLRSVPAIIQLDVPLETAFAVGRLPTHSENILGQPQEPVSLVILAADDAAFSEAFSQAGWLSADRPGVSTMSRAAFALWFNKEYETAPITPAFWNGRPNDFGFQIGTVEESLRIRHHARFWRTGFRTQDGLLIFAGTASFDDGLKWGLTHRIDPNIDAERDLLATDLQKTGLINSEQAILIVAPILGQNLTGDPFFTDGKAIVFRLDPDRTTITAQPEPGVPTP
jgi:membrane protein DedA with SNARE-associated domain/membrane-associated phospholipid phosphatase